MAFKSILPPTPTLTRPLSQIYDSKTQIQLNNLITRNFASSTILLTGALLQGLLVLAVPRVWTLLPTVLVLIARFADTLAITFKFRPNPYLEDVVFQRSAPVIPDEDGNMSNTPADQKVAVLLLCVKLNHPLGFFSPYAKEVGDFAMKMGRDLDAQAPNNGFLGQSQWHSVDKRGASELMLLSYWRSIDDVHKYSQSSLHLETWKWWDQTAYKDSDGLKHIGISHEVFEAPRSRWESVSINFQPTRLGATTYLRKGDKLIGGTVDDAWISPIVEAKGKMRTSKGRLNWADSSNDKSGAGEDRH
ncbi:hypothetical protein LTR64_003521 [Lithohypha guttulata]|uniref:uncharacterized protein n=1 Tax=Lithohypha guttulata TaxID=1690604 RepID=UPI002DE026C1|nr:hypothetical protein LTR51_000260 [Lithohypha guttulata]